MSDKPTVLFVCVHNAGRSQIEVVRGVRDEIRDRVRQLLADLRPAAG